MEGIIDTVRELSATYNVDPIIFGVLYIGGIPLFLGVAAWLAARARKKRGVTLQALLLLFLAIQPYLYVALFGENLPGWVYGAIAVLIGAGAWSTWRQVQKKKAEGLAAAEPEAKLAEDPEPSVR